MMTIPIQQYNSIFILMLDSEESKYLIESALRQLMGYFSTVRYPIYSKVKRYTIDGMLKTILSLTLINGEALLCSFFELTRNVVEGDLSRYLFIQNQLRFSEFYYFNLLNMESSFATG